MRIDGRRLADELLDRLAAEVARASAGTGCLATLVVGDDPVRHRQATFKHRAAERVGMQWRAVRLPGRATTASVAAAVDALADDRDVHGIFVHLPMPGHIDGEQVITHLPAAKDVDGLRDDSPFVAAAAHATLDVLRGVPLATSTVTVVGEASALTRGLSHLLMPLAADVVPLAPDDPGAPEASRRADIVVAAAHRACLVDAAWVGRGAAVVDAASGDVDVASVSGRAGLLCASPGGIGPLTVARLLVATHAAASRFPSYRRRS